MDSHDVRPESTAAVLESKTDARAHAFKELHLAPWRQIGELAEQLSSKLWRRYWHQARHLRDT
jgi:hypothetical protein